MVPVLLSMSSPDIEGMSRFTVGNADVSTMNAMRRYMLARLPVIGIPFTPFAANRVVVTANTTNETDQTIWHRLGNVPVNSLDPALVTQYAVVLDATNDRGHESRIVTTADLRLVRRSDLSEEQRTLLQTQLDNAAAPSRKKQQQQQQLLLEQRDVDDAAVDDGRGPVGREEENDDARAPVTTDVFPANSRSNHFIALAELLPPVAYTTTTNTSSSSAITANNNKKSGGGGALKLIATFAWLPGTGAYAPCVVGYKNAPNPEAIDAQWKEKAREIRENYERESAEIEKLNAAIDPASDGAAEQLIEVNGTLERTLQNAHHDFMLVGAMKRECCNPHEFIFEYTPINSAYPLRRAWRQAAKMIAQGYRDIIASVDEGSLVYLPASTAASSGYTSVTANAFVGGAGYDVILPNVDHGLGELLNYALCTLCFARTKAEFAEGSDRLNFCAFHRFTPDDTYGVIRLALVTDNSVSVPMHIRTACEALVQLFEEDIANLVQ